MFHNKARIAIDIMCELAENAPLTRGKIAANINAGESTVYRLIAKLREDGLISVGTWERGRGSHRLAKPPSDISIWEVIVAVTPPINGSANWGRTMEWVETVLRTIPLSFIGCLR